MRGTADMLVALSRVAWHRDDLAAADLLRRRRPRQVRRSPTERRWRVAIARLPGRRAGRPAALELLDDAERASTSATSRPRCTDPRHRGSSSRRGRRRRARVERCEHALGPDDSGLPARYRHVTTAKGPPRPSTGDPGRRGTLRSGDRSAGPAPGVPPGRARWRDRDRGRGAQAVAHRAAGDLRTALAALEHAVDLAEPQGGSASSSTRPRPGRGARQAAPPPATGLHVRALVGLPAGPEHAAAPGGAGRPPQRPRSRRAATPSGPTSTARRSRGRWWCRSAPSARTPSTSTPARREQPARGDQPGTPARAARAIATALTPDAGRTRTRPSGSSGSNEVLDITPVDRRSTKVIRIRTDPVPLRRPAVSGPSGEPHDGNQPAPRRRPRPRLPVASRDPWASSSSSVAAAAGRRHDRCRPVAIVLGNGARCRAPTWSSASSCCVCRSGTPPRPPRSPTSVRSSRSSAGASGHPRRGLGVRLARRLPRHPARRLPGSSAAWCGPDGRQLRHPLVVVGVDPDRVGRRRGAVRALGGHRCQGARRPHGRTLSLITSPLRGADLLRQARGRRPRRLVRVLRTSSWAGWAARRASRFRVRVRVPTSGSRPPRSAARSRPHRNRAAGDPAWPSSRSPSSSAAAFAIVTGLGSSAVVDKTVETSTVDKGAAGSPPTCCSAWPTRTSAAG